MCFSIIQLYTYFVFPLSATPLQEAALREAGVPLPDGAGTRKSFTIKAPEGTAGEPSTLGILCLGIKKFKTTRTIYFEPSGVFSILKPKVASLGVVYI